MSALHDGEVPSPAAPGGIPACWAPLVEALPDPTWIAEFPSRRIVAVNDPAVRLLGRHRDDLLGQRADELMATPEDLAWWSDAPGDASEPLHSDTVLPGPAGQLLHVRRSIRALGSGGLATHCVVVLVDRSDEVRAATRLETSVSELQATLESIADGLMVLDTAGRILAFNRRFAQMWAIPETLLEQHQDEAVLAWMERLAHDPEGYARRLQAARQAALMFSSEQITLRSGQVIERVSRPMWSRGRQLGRVFTFRDLSERARADAPPSLPERPGPVD